MSDIYIPIPNGFGVKRALQHLGIPIIIENDKIVLFSSRNKRNSCLVWLNYEPIPRFYMDLIILGTGITYKDMEDTGVLYD